MEKDSFDTNWKLVKELLDERDGRYRQRFDDQEKAVKAALAAAEKAVTKAETASEKRLDSVNEFRGQLKDQAGTFITRYEAYLAIMAAIAIASLLLSIFGKK